ncbi:hypothetical protein HWV07_08645 [Natronomonas salina]|uniref:hypothetical protein n=1 Tax=Natronomonas salina TaxID=1710540 RepID=UPI0015B5F8E8|nr:hypothetical protein [Natronomonas salina]QLD89094.1 hypothetical protein HWV07_08645 [Natronomonas salina]
MDRVVYYHHPGAENFSLKFSSESPATALARRKNLEGATKLIGYPFETPVYILYEGDTEITDATDIQFDKTWLSNQIEEFPREGQVVAFRLLELLEAAVDVREEDEFHLYKEFEPQKIQQALDYVSWGTSLPQVAGNVMSNLILRHSLPNANHRTGIAMLHFCIESADPAFELPRTQLDDETWQEWVDPYILESKRLTTVRRNNVRFKQLQELDVDLVERKDGIQIRLAEFELDMHWRDALSRYATRHEDHCTEFARAVLMRAGRDDLLDQAGPTKQDFLDYLETGLVERDFRELL